MTLDTFPYKSTFTSEETILSRISELKKRKPTLLSLDKPVYVQGLDDVDVVFDNDKYYLLEQFPEDYEKMNEFDFAEPVRIKCTRGKKLSPAEGFRRYEKEFIRLAIKKHGKNYTQKQLRDIVWRDRRIDECGTFRPSVFVDIIRQFGGKRVLDISAGWGDRLIAAIAANVSYIGTDPNKELMPYYKDIIKKYAPKNRRYEVHSDKFEDFAIPKFKFDTVITSPPYYDYELYSDKFLDDYPSVSEWVDTFLVPSVSRAIEALIPGGRAYIIINNTPQAKYCAEMIAGVKKQLGDSVLYHGVMCYAENRPWKSRDGKVQPFRNAQPIFVFENVNK